MEVEVKSGNGSPAPGVLEIDHANLAGQNLDELQGVLAQVGLPSLYGGVHSNGATHMAQLGFSDGTYLELISTLQPGQAAPWWEQAISANAGPCAWAVQTDDPLNTAKQAFESGVPVRGPERIARQRPDGARIEFELVYLGDGEPGTTLPFFITDRTDRGLRVQPTPGVDSLGLSGIGCVVLGVQSIVQSVQLFQRLFGWKSIQVGVDAELGARLAHFPGQPFVLAEPVEPKGWLGQRIARLGECPAAFLFASRDFAASARRLPLGAAHPWPFGGQLAWLRLPGRPEWRLGVMG